MFYQLRTSSRLPPAFHVLFICLDGSLPFHGCHTALCYGLLPPRCHIAEPLTAASEKSSRNLPQQQTLFLVFRQRLKKNWFGKKRLSVTKKGLFGALVS